MSLRLVPWTLWMTAVAISRQRDVVEFEGVHPSLIRRARRYASNGWIGKDDPKQASAEWGEQMLTSFADWAVKFLDAFAQSPLPGQIER